MLAAPFGVFALLAPLVVDAPSPDLFKALGLYSLCVLLGLCLMIIFYIILVRFYATKTPKFFLKGKYRHNYWRFQLAHQLRHFL